jgi:hypothetical protein
MEKKEYSWAAQLANYLYRLDPTAPRRTGKDRE